MLHWLRSLNNNTNISVKTLRIQCLHTKILTELDLIELEIRMRRIMSKFDFIIAWRQFEHSTEIANRSELIRFKNNKTFGFNVMMLTERFRPLSVIHSFVDPQTPEMRTPVTSIMNLDGTY